MNREIRVGLMFVISLAVLGVSLYYLGSFQETVSYQIRFAKVNGLAVDSPVHFNGVSIGRVTKIVLSEEADKTVPNLVPIIVTVSLHESVQPHIKTSTVADIRSVGVLGDKYVLLVTRDYSAPALEEGDFLATDEKTFDVQKLLEQGTDFVADATEITENLRDFLQQLTERDGTLQKLIRDEELATQLRDTLTKVLANMERDDTFFALLTADPQFANNMRGGLSQALVEVNNLLAKFQDQDGLLQTLMSDEVFRDEVKGKVTNLLDNASGYIERMSTSRGLVYRLMEDEAYGERVSQNIEKATYHLASILEKIDEGDGSAAMIVNDPQLYQGLYEVVYGIQHSGITKWFIQAKRRKGAEKLEKQSEKGSTP